MLPLQNRHYAFAFIFATLLRRYSLRQTRFVCSDDSSNIVFSPPD